MNVVKTAEEFLTKHGQSIESIKSEGKDYIQDFIAEMNKGMAANHQVLPMLPTYLCNISRTNIKDGKRILIDAGGTNFRSAIGHFDKDGKVVIERLHKTKMPASGGEVLNKAEFFGKIAENVAYLANDATDVGFCFSYPVLMGADLDGEVLGFSKEVKAPEVVGVKVGAETLKTLKSYSSADRKIVIVNDTVATLLGGMAVSNKQYSTYIGYIYGTGTNLCCIADTAAISKCRDLPCGNMLINMECGGYNGFKQGDFDKIVALRTDDPQRQQFEKMTSGKYLSSIMREALRAAVDEGLMSQSEITPFELKDVSIFLENGGGNLADMFEPQDRDLAKEICRMLVDRAAYMGATINAATAIATCKDKSLPIAIVAEGTTFDRMTGYSATFAHFLAEMLSIHGLTYEIIQGDDLNLIGTLMATMCL